MSAPNSPYLAFIVGLHVATAIAMIAYFWRDWLRIVRGFFSSLRTRSVTTPDERLAWMIILATIPVGIVGVALQKEFTKVFAKPELAAFFLAVNGVILLLSERMRRSRDAAAARRRADGGPAAGAAGAKRARSRCPGRASWGPGGPGGPGRPGGPGPEGWSQQPRQQQWQGPDPRYGQDGDPQYPGNGAQGQDGYGRPSTASRSTGSRSRASRSTASRSRASRSTGSRPHGQPQYGQPQYGQEQHGWDPRGGQPGQGWPPGGRRAARVRPA